MVDFAKIFATLTSAAALTVALLPAPQGVAPSVMNSAALGLFVLGLWATGVVGMHVASIWFFVLAMLFQVAPAPVIFSGFHSAAFWTVFGGVVLGMAVHETGLGARIARVMASRFSASYFGILVGVTLATTALSFLVPSAMGRSILLAPVVVALADRLGFAPGSRGRTGIILAAVYGAMFPAFAILPSNIPNLVLMGASERLYGIVPTYGAYLLLHYPVLGFLKAVFIAVLAYALFPDRLTPPPHEAPSRAMSPGERRVAVILALAMALWITDFVHHISPAWVALGAAILCLLPGIGVVTPAVFERRIDFAPMFYVAGVLGLGAMISETELGVHLGRTLLDVAGFAPGETLRNFVTMVGLTSVVGIATTQPGIPAVLTPLAASIAEATALPLESVLMLQVIGFSALLLPYQSPPIIVALTLSGLRVATAIRYSLVLFAATVVILLPLDYVWWRILGYLP